MAGQKIWIKRSHLFEFHDLAWLPAMFRDALTEWLRVLWARIDAYHAIAPIVGELLNESGATQVVDLCSGAGGPLFGIQQRLQASGRRVKFIVTDKFVNVDKMRDLQNQGQGMIDARLASVDATTVPRELPGLRTLFNSFHHFRPLQAQQILKDAYDARQPIAIFEIPSRTTSGILFSFFASFLGVLLFMPMMRPMKPAWWVFTYLLPIIPFIVAWDGWVSHLRAYSPAELLQMTGAFADSYRWEIRRLELAGGLFSVTCFLGLPGDPTVRAPTPALQERLLPNAADCDGIAG
jgi:hypothetical protein